MLSVYNKEQFVDLLCKSNDSHAPAVNFWEQAVYALNNMPKYYGKEVIIKKVIHYTGSYSDILYLTLGQNFIALYVVPVEKDIGREQGIFGQYYIFEIHLGHCD